MYGFLYELCTKRKDFICAFLGRGTASPDISQEVRDMPYANTQQELDVVERAIKELAWWQFYKGTVMGAMKAAIQLAATRGLNVNIIGIRGGNITRVEQRNMPAMIRDVCSDLGLQQPHLSSLFHFYQFEWAEFRSKWGDNV